jgi:6-phosphogluconolactonase
VNGELLVVQDVPGEFSQRVISAFVTRQEEDFSVVLSGGDTARRCYERLAAESSSRIDWWLVDVYWGDERCVPPDDPESNQLLARRALLERVGTARSIHPMRCEEGADPYQLRVGEVGRFDVLHLGLGGDGHTASLFPGSAGLEADPGRLVVMNSDPSGANPHMRMTLTLSGIARARLALFTVMGEEKQPAMQRIAEGEDLPAARVEAERVLWLVDEAAAPR